MVKRIHQRRQKDKATLEQHPFSPLRDDSVLSTAFVSCRHINCNDAGVESFDVYWLLIYFHTKDAISLPFFARFFFSLFFNTTTCARDFVYLSLNISVALFLSQSLFLYRNNLTFVIRTFPSIGGRNRICARNNDNSNIIMLAIMITVISEKEATIILLVMVVLS